MSTKRVKISELVAGMQVAADVYAENDQLIIPKNSILTDAMINRLDTYGIYSIRIKEEVNTAPPAQPAPASHSYHERLKASPEFKVFQAEYTKKVDSLKNSMNSIIEDNADINVDNLLSQTTDLLSKSRTSLHVFDILASLIDSGDIIFTHSINVSLLAAVLGKWLGYSQEDIQLLSLAGLLHDIGKQMVPQEILTKQGKLTNEEFELLKSHAAKGYDILSQKNLDSRICDAALTHHERCDGSGYPYGLKGDEIQPFAKIIAIADVYDAMTANRSYREPICPFEVIRRFEEDGYQKYDPHMIMVFLENVVSTYVGNNVILSNGQTGEVIMINKLDLSRPIVKTQDNQFIDLSQRRNLKIVSIV